MITTTNTTKHNLVRIRHRLFLFTSTSLFSLMNILLLLLFSFLFIVLSLICHCHYIEGFIIPTTITISPSRTSTTTTTTTSIFKTCTNNDNHMTNELQSIPQVQKVSEVSTSSTSSTSSNPIVSNTTSFKSTAITTDTTTSSNNTYKKNMNQNTICRIVATADYKIPSTILHNHNHNHNHILLSQIDALLHATTHQTSQRPLKYMEFQNQKIKNNRSMSSSSSSSSTSTTTSSSSKSIMYNSNLYNPNHNHQEEEEEDDDDDNDEEDEKNVIWTLKQSLKDAGFQLLSERDVELCEALNEGYLLRLSILPDVMELDPSIGAEFYPELYCDVDDDDDDDIIIKNINNNDNEGMRVGDSDTLSTSSPNSGSSSSSRSSRSTTSSGSGLLFDGRILVYRRGYSEEVTRGRLLLPKFDYLQSNLVQRTASNFAKQLGEWERKISNKAMGYLFDLVSDIMETMPQRMQHFIVKMTGIKFDYKEGNVEITSQINNNNNNNSTSKSKIQVSGKNTLTLRRYRTGNVIDSPDNNDALSPFLVCEIANGNSTYDDNDDDKEMDVESDLYDVLKEGTIACQRDSNIHNVNVSEVGTRTSSSNKKGQNIQLLRRVSIANLVDFFSTGGRRRLIKSLFSESELVEPTYEEVRVCIESMIRYDITNHYILFRYFV
jgi:uncharacterized membrane protein